LGPLKLSLTALCAALALAACGGSDDATTTSAPAASDAATTAEVATTDAATTDTTATDTTAAAGGDAACKTGEPPLVNPKSYAKPPAAPKGDTLTMETSCGTITFALDRDLGGEVADAVAGLAADGFYDGLTFHRVVPDFVLQGGDPAGTGAGGPGFSTVKAPPTDYAYALGDLAMAKTQDEAPGTGGSQFFVISGAQGQQLPPDYAVIAHATDPASLATIARIAALAVEDGPPSQPVWIVKATVS
jgi:peptidyl-prolyl cis-trans isomerase B (cyclophilin B)